MGRLVAPMTMTWDLALSPSIKVKSWDTMRRSTSPCKHQPTCSHTDLLGISKTLRQAIAPRGTETKRTACFSYRRSEISLGQRQTESIQKQEPCSKLQSLETREPYGQLEGMEHGSPATFDFKAWRHGNPAVDLKRRALIRGKINEIDHASNPSCLATKH